MNTTVSKFGRPDPSIIAKPDPGTGGVRVIPPQLGDPCTVAAYVNASGVLIPAQPGIYNPAINACEPTGNPVIQPAPLPLPPVGVGLTFAEFRANPVAFMQAHPVFTLIVVAIVGYGVYKLSK